MRGLSLIAIDDEQLVLEAIKLAAPDIWKVQTFTRPPKGLGSAMDAALVDIHLGDNADEKAGLKLIEELHKSHSNCEIIAISGDLNRETMEAALKVGASRFLAKPLSRDELVMTLDKIEALHRIRESAARGKRQQAYWVGQSKSSQELKKQLAFLRGEMGPILIEGETGTGKEVAAQILNQQEDCVLVTCNVASLPENTFESEFFGHMKGSFTGANQNKVGLAEAAHGGDLFLDEIEALPMSLQAKLLRFLETGEVRPLGSNVARTVSVRIIAASNKPLERMVKDGEFREDLFWRLAKHHIRLPALRDRKEDLSELTDWFFSQDPSRSKELSDEALSVFHQYDWPGNVRELKRLCEQLILKAPLPLVRLEDVVHLVQSPDPHASFAMDLSEGLEANLKRFEKQLLLECLKETPDIDMAAKQLKISRSNLYKKLKDHSIDRSENA